MPLEAPVRRTDVPLKETLLIFAPPVEILSRIGCEAIKTSA
jgi:hypothetical protein